MALRPEHLQILVPACIAMAGGDAHLHHPIRRNQHIRQDNRLASAAEEAPHRRGQPHHFFQNRIKARGTAAVIGRHGIPRCWRPGQAVKLLLQPGQLGWMLQQAQQQTTQGRRCGFVAGEQEKEQLLCHVSVA